MRLLILACCLMINPALAAHNPPGDTGFFAVQLPPDAGSLYSRDRAIPSFRAEWWRLTASLADREGKPWQLEWTLYRQAPGPSAAETAAWGGTLSLAHAAIVTPDGGYHERRFSGGGPVRASRVPADGTSEWQWVSRGETLFPARLSFSIDDREVNFLLESIDVPPAVYSGAGDEYPARARHYPSQPRIRVRGFVDRGADKTYLSGRGRFDREWNARAMAE